MIICCRRIHEQQKTYNTGDSLVVTDPTTNPALRSLTMGERTGSRIFYELWSQSALDSEGHDPDHRVHKGTGAV
ncbi:unnamed protein product [Fusarium graminearum]|uniref:Uncharacterized protein n=1 Tax=Gibberella zeae TaxID=5518 RepID=A0A4E9DJL1_GIBZA|nr:unnamed protein product [Fusarium graminearum]CAF3492172.1 unnamed protein product [Fusarium graminearum]CAG1960336.1 unnamed protein product [Fusarium graminearum]CAG1978102.1 unnamed protein product [Fusarium graminearum]